MIIYLVKSFLLLTLLFAVYKLLLENEKMHQFNRFFLLFALVFGLIAPLISFDLNPGTKVAGIELQKVGRVVNAPAEIISKSVAPKPFPTVESAPVAVTQKSPSFSISKEQIIWGIYGFITFLLLIRFGYGLFQLWKTVRSGQVTKMGDSTLVLVEERLTPQSFLKFIFLNKKDFESGKIGEEILAHEGTHVKQLHSLDILFIELLKVVFWFNPVLHFYKHAIQLNHEFIADDRALNESKGIQNYQSLLLNFTSDSGSKTITSNLDFSLTKKRFLMMGKKFSLLRSSSKSAFLIPAFCVLTFLFCAKSNPDSHFSWSGPKGSEVYADVDVVPKNPLDLRFYTHKGTPYSGELNLYVLENDQLYSKYTFENGLMAGGIWFDEKGKQTSRTESMFENGTQAGFREYDANDQIVSEWIGTPEPSDSLKVFRDWRPNGTLKFEMFAYVENARPQAYEGLMTLYDEQGNILEQELYNKGELVEKIK